MLTNQIQIISTPNEVQVWLENSINRAFQNLGLNSNTIKPVAGSNPITTKELCKYLKISSVTCIRWRKKGKIPFMKIGGSIRYDKAAVLAAIESSNGGKAA